MGGAGFPPCWPEVTQHWSLPGLFGGANGRLREGSRQGVLPRTSSASFLVLTVSHSLPASAGDPPTLAVRSGSVSYGVTASSPGSWCTHYFVCALQECSLCFPSLVKILQSNPLAFKVWFSRNSPTAGPPGWEAWRGAQNLHSSGWTSVV